MEGPLKGTVLLAEDTLVNQQVALAMLESLGCLVEIAANGREALDALARRPFDSVVMDCRTPDMDRLEATRRVRAREASRGNDERGMMNDERGEENKQSAVQHSSFSIQHWPHIPIVALTAHAGERDRADCLAVGMDDFLAKPVCREELRTMLARHLPPVARAPESGQPGPAEAAHGHVEPAAGGAPPVLAPQALEQLRALQQGSRPDLIARVINVYLTDAPRLLAAMRDAVRRGDASALEQAAHSLKSSSAALGAGALSACCKELEVMGHAKALARAETLLVQAEAGYRAAGEALTDYLARQTGDRMVDAR